MSLWIVQDIYRVEQRGYNEQQVRGGVGDMAQNTPVPHPTCTTNTSIIAFAPCKLLQQPHMQRSQRIIVHRQCPQV